MASAKEILEQVSLFEGVKHGDLKKLANDCHDVSFPAGTTLTEDHGFGTTFFLVAEGGVEISVGGQTVRTIGPGDYFGEMAVIDKDTRSATAIATTDTRCLVFSRPVFRPFIRNHPDVAWALLERMVARVREAEARVTA